jgi:hypothetical protein
MLADEVTIYGTLFKRVNRAMIQAMRHTGVDETLVTEIAAEFAAFESMGPSG